MRYLLLITGDETRLNDGSRTAAWGTYTQDLVAQNKMRAGERLRPSSSATTVRIDAGKRLLSDGPFAETKEQLGGFYIVEAANLDEAVELASKMPHLEAGGSVEVRPIWELNEA